MPVDAWEDEWRQIGAVARLCRRAHATDLATALNGHGGLYAGGRWHKQGQPVVYTGSSRSVCVLERLVHLDAGLHDASVDLVFMRFRIPSSISRKIITPTMLGDLAAKRVMPGQPQDWRTQDHPLCLRLGRAWLASNQSCLLVVPSSVVPQEANVLINPAHPDMAVLLAANADSFAVEDYRPDRRVAEVVQFATGRSAG